MIEELQAKSTENFKLIRHSLCRVFRFFLIFNTHKSVIDEICCDFHKLYRNSTCSTRHTSYDHFICFSFVQVLLYAYPVWTMFLVSRCDNIEDNRNRKAFSFTTALSFFDLIFFEWVSYGLYRFL